MKFRFLSIILIAALWVGSANAQSITNGTLASAGGQFKNGSIVLDYTIGEPFVKLQSNGPVSLGFGFWTVVPATYVSSMVNVYKFVGSGNFTDPANWANSMVPPNPLPANSEIIINNVNGGQCILNISYNVSPNSRVTVVLGSNLIIPGLLRIQ